MMPLRKRFTLIEVLLVVFILAAVAGTAATLVGQADEQFRYDDTKARREELRRAILGDPTRTVNGQPVVSGFVADTGRLPLTVQELIEGGSFAFVSTETWPTTTVHHQYAGQRGPYLRADTERATGALRPVFRDGWRNADVGALDPNFGWVFPPPTTTDLFLQSRGSDGLDQTVPPTGPFSYTWDYPPDDGPLAARLIAADDWLARSQGWSIRVKNSTATAVAAGTTVRLRVIFPLTGDLSSGFATGWQWIDSDPVACPAIAVDATSDPLQVSFPATARAPWGRRSVCLVTADQVDQLGAPTPVTLLPGAAPVDILLTLSPPP